MSLLGGLIGGAFSLFGGMKGASDERKGIAAQNRYNNPLAIRQRAEAAGFNPLLFIGPGVGNQTSAAGAGNIMGSAIANAGAMVADGIETQSQLRQQNEALRAKTDDLFKRLQAQTLRPKVGGIYSGGTVSTPTATTTNVWPTDPALRPGRSSEGLSYGAMPDAYEPTMDDVKSGSDGAAGIPKVPLKLFGMEFYPSGRNSDAAVVEERFGEDGPVPAVVSTAIGLDEGGHLLRQTKFGMIAQQWVRGDYSRMREDRSKMAEDRAKAKGNWRFNPAHRDGYFPVYPQ